MNKKLSKLLVIGLAVIALPLAAGTLSGCGNNPDPGPVETSYIFTAKNGTGYSITVRSGATLDAQGKAEVKYNTQIQFTVDILDGYKQHSAPIVKANGVELTKTADSSYFVTVKDHTTISVSGIKADDILHDVAFVSGDGYSFSNVSVSLDGQGKARVIENTNVTFKVEIAKGYDGTDMLVCNNTTVLIPNNDGIYNFDVKSNCNITVIGVKQEAAKYNVTFVTGVGYSYANSSHPIVNNVATVTENDELYFQVNITPGYDGTLATVTANGVIVPLNLEDDFYHVFITSDTQIIVNNVDLEEFVVTMINTDAYTFTDITGVSLIDGIGGAHIGDEISFKVSPKEGYEVTKNLKVKVGDKELTPVDDVYTFTVSGNSEVEVNGIEVVETIILPTFIKNDSTEVKDVNNAKGYEKSFEFLGNYHKADFFDVELARYTELRFSVKCVNEAWFEILRDGEDYTDYATKSNAYVEYKFVRTKVIDPETLEDFGYNYSCYFNDVLSSIVLDQDEFLNDIFVRFGCLFTESGQIKESGIFHISELRGRINSDYEAPEKPINFAEGEVTHHTITVEGQTAPYKGKLGETFTFDVTPDATYTSVVTFNGKTISPVSGNTYEIEVTRSNLVEIQDVKVLTNKVLASSIYDDSAKTSTASSYWGVKNVLSGFDLDGVNAFFFDVSFSKTGYFGIGATGVIKDVFETGTCMNGDTYRFTFTKTENENEYKLSVSLGRTDYTGHPIFTLTNLNQLTMMFQSRAGDTNTATFSRVFSID